MSEMGDMKFTTAGDMMMKYYTWIEPNFDESENYLGAITMVWSEEQILESYWPWWHKAMIAKYGEGHELITEDNCIQDFVVCHWAVEVKDESGRSKD